MDLPFEHGSASLPACTGCDGIGVTLIRCSCTRTTGRSMIEAVDPAVVAAPFPGCLLCKGSGTQALTCTNCSGAGRIRPQVVYTVLNLDTGAVASETVIPGAITPVRCSALPEGKQLWELPVSDIVDHLVAQVGGVLDRRHHTTDMYRKNLPLANTWAPDLPIADRLQLEAAAIARTQALTRHRHFFTTTTAAHRPSPADRLSELARQADLLHLDLCCYRFPAATDAAPNACRSAWIVAFALPDDDRIPVPSPVPRATLAEALEAADPLALLRKVQHDVDPSQPVPASYVDPAHLAPDPRPATSNPAAIAAQLEALAGPNTGALAVRREGRWHFTRLASNGAVDDFVETLTGQVRCKTIPTWRPDTTPPAPSWRGRPIPDRECPQCATGTTWTPCECIDTLTDRADPACDTCGGTGSRQAGSCIACGRTGRVRYGYTVTVTDLRDFARHWNFDFDTCADHQPQPWPPLPELHRHQLPELDRLAAWLFEAGIDYAELRTLFDLAPTPDLVHGGVLAPPGTPVRDVVHQHTRERAAGHAGGRIFLIWRPPARATVLQATRLAWGLGFELVIGAEDRNAAATAGTARGGMRWGAKFVRPGEPVDRALTGTFGKRHLAEALQASIDHLPHLLNVARGTKPGPTDIIPAPQQSDPPHLAGAERLEPVLSRLATHHSGVLAHTLVVRLSPAQVSVTRLTAGAEARLQPVVPLIESPTLSEALLLIDPAAER